MITDAQLDVLVQTYDAWKPSMRSIHQNQVLDALSELQVRRLELDGLASSHMHCDAEDRAACRQCNPR